MRIANVTLPDGRAALCRIEADSAVPLVLHEPMYGDDPLRRALAEDLLLGNAPAAPPVPIASCTMLAPVIAPQKIVALGLNYESHAHETDMQSPANPIVFVKTSNSIIGPEGVIEYSTRHTNEVDYEAELAVIIGRRARNVTEEDALAYVLGYTACNDVTARDAQFADGQWARGKSFDTFCPLGPWIVTADEIPDPQDLAIECRVNGALTQEASTKEMLFGVAYVISYLSRTMTLEPGDVVSTGTPEGVGFSRVPPLLLRDGDSVEVEIERIGTLRNSVRVVA